MFVKKFLVSFLSLYILSCITAHRFTLGIVDSILSYPSILAISSAISAILFRSFLQKGICSFQFLFSIHRFVRIFRASFSLYSFPVRLFIFSRSKEIVISDCLFSYESE